jgi:hypothetical protein
MEKIRAIKFEAIGLNNSTVDAADATYKGDDAYTVNSSATTTLSGALTSGATSMTVASGGSFPGSGQFRVRIDDEMVRITAGAGSSTWTITRAADGTVASAHSSGANVIIVQRVDLPTCGSSPCTTMVPTKNVTGADGRAYRLDTYVTWTGVKASGGASGRSVKLVTMVVRDQAAPYRTWARVASTFDESTGL